MQPPLAKDESIRRLAQHELQNATESRRTILEEHSSAFRWLLASLLAINGGGIVVSKELFAAAPLASVISDGFFVLGIMCALLTAWFSQRANRAMIQPLSEMVAFWIACIETNDFDPEVFKEASASMAPALKKARPTQLCGWVSASAFLIGSTISLSCAYEAAVQTPQEKIKLRTTSHNEASIRIESRPNK